MWNYIFTIFFIEEKRPCDRNGAETYILKHVKSHDISWIPAHRALVLEEQRMKDISD